MDIDIYTKNDTGWGAGGPDIGIKGPLPTINTISTIKGDPVPLTTVSTIKGDQNSPITTLILGDPTKPVTTLIEGDPTKPVTTLMLGDPTRPLATLLQGDPNKPITFSIKDLPRIELSTDMGFKPTRIHNPLHFEFCISLFGLEVLTFAVCGEAMTIVEPYLPHKTETCA
jgi:hypothetical protein